MPEPKEEKPIDSTVSIPEVKNGLDALTGSMPEVVPDAVAAAKAQETELKNKFSDFVDSTGTKFDPTKHVTDKDGNPKLSISNKLKLKPGVRPGGKSESFIKIDSKPAETQADPQRQKVHAAAVQFADSFIGAGRMIVGDEWNDQPGERDTLIDANEKVFEKYGVVEIHPIANITMVYGLYIFKRVMKPESKSQALWNKICRDTKQTFKNCGDWFNYTIMKKPRPTTSKPQEKKPEVKTNAETS